MKLPKPRKLNSGKWYIQTMIDGQRISKTFASEAEALYWASGIRARADAAEGNTCDLSIGQAIDIYIEQREAVLSPSTILGYKRMKKNCFPSIERLAIRDITQQKIQAWVNRLSKTLSPKSVANAHGLLSAVLHEFRPAMTISTALPKKVKPDIKIPSESEIRAIADKAKGTVYELPILLASQLGLRESEIRGLERASIDNNGYISIKSAIVQGEKGPVLKATKTFSGKRILHVPEYIAELIRALPENQKMVTELSGQAIYKGFSRICERAGVQHFRFHDLRHYYASVMLALGIPDKYQMENMGHATNNMLKAVYQHTIEEQKKNYNSKIEDYFNSLLV